MKLQRWCARQYASGDQTRYRFLTSTSLIPRKPDSGYVGRIAETRSGPAPAYVILPNARSKNGFPVPESTYEVQTAVGGATVWKQRPAVYACASGTDYDDVCRIELYPEILAEIRRASKLVSSNKAGMTRIIYRFPDEYLEVEPNLSYIDETSQDVLVSMLSAYFVTPPASDDIVVEYAQLWVTEKHIKILYYVHNADTAAQRLTNAIALSDLPA